MEGKWTERKEEWQFDMSTAYTYSVIAGVHMARAQGRGLWEVGGQVI